MASSRWTRWLRSLFRPEGKTVRRASRLSVERLECRVTPTTYKWTGLGADPNWDNSANWINTGTNLPAAPTGVLDDLVFPIGPAATNTNNNLKPPTGFPQPTFNSISISGDNYTLGGNALTLGTSSVFGSGFVNVAATVVGADITLNVALGGAAGSDQFFGINNGAVLTLDGQLSGNTGSSLTKEFGGNLVLKADNSAFTGVINLTNNGGVITITNNKALGDTSNPTIVGSNAQVAVQSVAGTINEPLLLNGPGPANDGALLNVSGTNTWAGNIVLSSAGVAVTLGANAGSLNITGQISDQGNGQNVIKEGAGQIIFGHVGGNTYRGSSTINNGILTIRDPYALGEPLAPPTGITPSPANGTIVNQTLTKVGTLQIEDPSGIGFTVRDEQLTLNGTGVTGPSVTTFFGATNIGALANLKGNNTWAGPVLLGSPSPNGRDAWIGVATASTLTVSGVVSSPNGSFNLTKADQGRLIFNNANTYTGMTDVELGILNIRDSQGLGGNLLADTTVQSGAALELEVDIGFDVHGRNLSIDSMTGANGNGPQLGLTVQKPLNLFGSGINNTGALHSISGINKWTGVISLAATAAIGVDADPNPSNTNSYFTHDYSLTVTSPAIIQDYYPVKLNINISGNLVKVGTGQLILPNANAYTGTTSIASGWITIQDDASLGVLRSGSDTIQPAATVLNGAALHLKNSVPTGAPPGTPPTPLNVVRNLVLNGTGIGHPFALINQKGALMNLSGNNTIGGPDTASTTRYSDIQLNGVVGVGVETLGPDAASELNIHADISDAIGTTGGGITKYGSQRLDLQGFGSYTGTVTVSEGVLRAQSNTALGTQTSGTALGTQVYTDTTTFVGPGIQEVQTITISGANAPYTLTFKGQSATIPFGAPAGQVQTALNALSTIGGAGGPGGLVSVNQVGNVYAITFGGSFVGFDQPQLIPNAPAGTIVLVATLMNGDGSALELQNGIPLNSGGASTGLDIWNEKLVLASPGNTGFGDAPLTAVSNDNMWRGTVSLNQSSAVQVQPGARLTLFGTIDDAGNTSGVGSDLTLAGASEVQTLTLSALSGMFMLAFKGQSTVSVDASSGSLANDVQNALNNLPTLMTVGGTATVTQSGKALTITFGGTLSGFNQPLLGFTGDGTLKGSVTADGGVLALAGSNTYLGSTFVNQGVLLVENGAALGGTGIPEVQTLTFTTLSGLFTLTFNSQATGSLDASKPSLAIDVQNALNNLSTVGGVGGVVSVVPNANGKVLTVTFGSTLSGLNQPLLVPSAGSGITPATVTDGAGGTVVANGASLQLQGGITVAGEPLILQGQGVANAENVPVGWFSEGPAPINGGQTSGSEGVSGRVTTVLADPTDSRVLYIGTAGGGVWKTKNDGLTWEPLFDFQDGLDEIQKVTAPASGTFQLEFIDRQGVPASTALLPFNATAQQVQAALNALPTIGGEGGSVSVTLDPNLPAPNVYTITFQGNLAGANQSSLADPTSAATIITIQDGVPATSAMYVGALLMPSFGPTQATNSQTIYLGTGEANSSNESYYGTGLYKSIDSGKHWTLVTDPTLPIPNPFLGKGITKMVQDPRTGNIFIADGDGALPQNEVQTIRVAANPFTLTFRGKTTVALPYTNAIPLALQIQIALNNLSTIGGAGGLVTVTALGGNFQVVFGGSLSFTNVPQLISNPGPFNTGGAFVNVTTVIDGGSKLANGTVGVLNAAAGVWRYNPNSGKLFNLTAVISTFRSPLPIGTVGQAPFDVAPPGTPGPDDDFRISFPQNRAVYSDVAVIDTDISNGLGFIAPVIYIALGESLGDLNDGVYWSENPNSNTPIFYTGDPGGSPFSAAPNAKPPSSPDARPTSPPPFPENNFADYPASNPMGTAIPINGNVKITAIAGSFLNNSTVYASVATPDPFFNNVYVTTTGGQGWAPVTVKPPDYMSALQGNFANAILATSATNVVVGGTESSNVTHAGQLQQTTSGGAGWVDISLPGPNGDGPRSGVHWLARDNAGRLLAATDGGLWRLEANGNWTDLTGTLTVAQINSVASNPTDPRIVFAGVQSNGVAKFTNDLAWTTADGNSGGQVRVDPKTPTTVYAVEMQTGVGSIVRQSLDSGKNWATVYTSLEPTDPQTLKALPPLVLDAVTPTRLLVGGQSLQETTNQGGNWTSLNVPLTFISSIAIAQFQGTFKPDRGFPLVLDKGSNTYDPNTIYATDGSTIYLTKDLGVSWKDRSIPAIQAVPTAAPEGNVYISSLTVDPRNRDTIFVTRAVFGGAEVFMSQHAGFQVPGQPNTWVDLDPNKTLPNIAGLGTTPVWTLVIDPRSDNLYIGTDEGVYVLQGPALNAYLASLNGGPSAPAPVWQHFGAGMPNVQVRDLELNLNTNTLLAGTYGRGVYVLYLNDNQPNAGSLRALSGSSVWTGVIQLAGDPVINNVFVSANGSQALQNGLVNAQLNLIGNVVDQTFGSNPRLVKVGGGNVILSGTNTYGGVTEVRDGVLVVHNPQALGSSAATANTIVDAGKALELQSDLQLEPIVLNGDGFAFNDHNTGALRNVSNNNTYTGQITLNTDSTIGVDSGTTLTIGSKAPLLMGNGSITDAGASPGRKLTKELTGTLTLANADTYGGLTEVVQGVLQVQHALALGTGGTAASGTDVFNGAQLQLQAPTPGGSLTVSGEFLSLVGTGIFNTGALLDSAGNNTWQGPVTLRSDSALGTTNPNETMTIDGAIGQAGGNFGFTKVGLGRVTLTSATTHAANSYGSITTVAAGALRIQDPNALGLNQTNAVPIITIAPSNNNGLGYAGLDFNSSGLFAPPDTAGAAGPTTYVETVNQTIAVFSPKATGATALSTSFSNFFNTVGGLPVASASSNLSDPIVVYDDTIGRFIVGDQDVDFGPAHVSTFDFAVSKTSNPTSVTAADWTFYQVSTTEAGFDADYPGNFGFNGDAFVFTLNMFNIGAGANHVLITTISAADLAAGVSQAALLADPMGVNQNDFNGFNLRPTVMHDSLPNDPMWFVQQGSGSSIDVVRMTNVLSSAASFSTFNLAVATYADAVPPLNPDGTVITSKIDSRILKAAEWNKTLVATHSVSFSATEDDVRWYVIDLSTGTPMLKDQGSISAGDKTYLTYPGIDINAAGSIGITYMRSGTDFPTDFLSMYVTGRVATDPLGTMEASVLVPSGVGQDNYSDFTPTGRAGDLSGINVDPVDGSFWAVNEFANTLTSGANWGTAIANFTPGKPANGTLVSTGASLEVDSAAAAGFTVIGETLTLNANGTPEVQQLTVTGTVGSFSLTINGTPTALLPFNANASQIQAALNTALGAAGSVTVIPYNGTFLIVFGGALAGANQPPIGASGKFGTTATVTTVADGGQGALRNVTGSNTYAAAVTLQTNSSVGVAPATQLTINGGIQDPTVAAPLLAPVPAASLTKVGTGTLVLPNPNSYGGITFVNEGVLNIQDPLALGGNSGPEEQQITVRGASGTFTLAFNGQTTISLSVNDANLRGDMEAALDALSSIGAIGAYVTVTQGTGTSSNVYTVDFNGSLRDTNVAPITALANAGVTIVLATLRDGPEGTVVNSGATLQLQLAAGNNTVQTENLTLNGQGFNNAGALEDVSGFDATWAQPITLGSTAAVGVDNAGNTLTLNQAITAAGGAVPAPGLTAVGPGTVDLAGTANNTYTGLTQVNQGILLLDKSGAAEVQVLTILGSSGTFTLTYTDMSGPQTTGMLQWNVAANGGVLPTDSVQNALQFLPNILPGNVTVTSNGRLYTITFTGALAQIDVQPLTGNGFGGAKPVLATVTNGTGAAAAFGGDLTVGDTVGAAATAIARWTFSNQVSDTATVTVNSDGKMDLNGKTETVGTLTIIDGQATTGAAGTGQLTLANPNALNMTGGTLTIPGLGTGAVTLGGNVTATSDAATGSATITGTGTLALGSATRTFNVADGPNATDLLISTPIAGGAGAGLTMDVGTGTLQLTATSTYPGLTTVKAGDLQVDGKIGAVVLNGGTLSGQGGVGTQQVGTIAGPAPAGTAVGTVSPGDNGGSAKGILHSGAVTWGAGTTFAVDLSAPALPALPAAGTHYDQLAVTGNVALGGANLKGTVTGTIPVGDMFTIIQATGGTVSGTFAQSPSIFITGNKFNIDTTTDPTKVVLTKVRADVTLQVSSSSNPSTYGQPVIFTVQVLPEAGATAIPAGDTVTFTLDAGTPGQVVAVVTVVTNPNGTATATFDPQAPTALNGPLTVTTSTPHTLSVMFSGDPNLFNPKSGALNPSQSVNPAPTTTTVAPVNPIYGLPVQLTATIAPPLNALVVNSVGPTGSVVFTVSGPPAQQTSTNGITVNASANTSTSDPFNGLEVGAHTFTAAYSGDGNYVASTTAAGTSFTVGKDNSVVTVTVDSASASSVFYSQTVTLTATITPFSAGSSGKPGGNVTFWDGPVGTGTNLGTRFLIPDPGPSDPAHAQSTAMLTNSSLHFGMHMINVQYTPTDGHYFGSSSNITTTNLTVNADGVTTVVTSSSNPSGANQPVTFTATVTNQVTNGSMPGPVPLGKVTFTVDGGTPSAPSPLDASGKATFTTSSLSITPPPAAPHTIIATYLPGTTDFVGNPPDSGPFSQIVLEPSLTTVSPTPNPSTFGQSIDVAANVAAGPGFSGTPMGTVTFLVNGAVFGSPVNLVAGQAHTMLTPSNGGSYILSAMYNGDASFAPSTAPNVTQVVNPAPTTTTIVSLTNPSTFGQAVIFRATVASVNPGLGTPGGSVTFVIDSTPQGSAVNLDSNGQATVSLNLRGGVHVIGVNYNGTANFAAGSAANPVNQNVQAAPTSTTIVSGLNPSTFGQAVTYTATVTSTPSAGTPAGDVTFTIDGKAQSGTVALNPNGQASVSLNLPGGPHTVGVTFNGTADNSTTDFAPSTAANPVNQTVQAASTTATISSSLNPSTFGQAVTFMAAVTNTSTSPTPDGSVTFLVNGAPQGSPVALDTNGRASVTLNLGAGDYTVTVNYPGSGSFASSTPANPVMEHVAQATSTTTIGSSQNPSKFGQPVTFTAAVTSPTTTPIGSVTFLINGTPQANSVPLDGTGHASITLNNQAAGGYTVTVNYPGNANILGSSPASPIVETVGQGTTSTTLTESLGSTSFGQAVDFTATVTSPTSVPVTGSVTFTIDSKTQSVTLDPSGKAVLTRSNLDPGQHSISVSYATSANLTGSSAGPVTLVVSQAATSVTVASAPNPSTFGQAVTFTATVTNIPTPTAPPTGSAVFTIDNTAQPATPLDASGKATLVLSNLSFGPHSVSARYLGNIDFASSSAATALTQNVVRATTSTSITSSGSPTTYGQAVTFTATVTSPTAPPTGTVVFAIDSTNQPAVNLNAQGKATLTLTNLAAGDHTITANYSGNANLGGSSPANPIVQTVKQAATATTLTSSLSSSTAGQPVTFTAAVSSAFATPDGTVTFVVDGVPQAPTALDAGGKATLTLSNLGIGSHTVAVSYAGNANFGGSSPANTASVTVAQAGTAMTLTASPGTPVFGQPVTFTAAVFATFTVPNGTVTFNVDGVDQAPTALDANGKATLTLNNLSVGPHTVAVSYAGNASFGASSPSGPVTVTVAQAGTTTALASSGNPSAVGQPVTFTATVSSPFATPGGTVTFTVDNVNQPAGTLDASGKATLTLSNLAAGTHTVVAGYSGSTGFTGSSSGALTQSVFTASSIAVTESAASTVFGQPVTFTATVTPALASAGTPTGTVVFFVDNGGQPPVSLNAQGQAILTLSNLLPGTHTITASYGGNLTVAPSGPSKPVTETVSGVATTITVAATGGTPGTAQPVTFIATVLANSPSTAVPTGSVTFTVDGVGQGAVGLDGSGRAGLTVTFQTLGAHTVTATYNATGPFAPNNGQQATTTVFVTNFRGSPIQSWVNQAFLDLLGRAADPNGLAFWSGQLEADISGNPIAARTTAARQIENSDEYRTSLILKLYREILGRVPAPADVDTQLGVLRSGVTIEEFKAQFLGSPEYSANGGRDNFFTYTDAVYRYVLGHGADAGAQAFWVQYLQTHSRHDMALSILQSGEAYGVLVKQLYVSMLHRSADGSPNAWFVALTQGARDEDVAAGIAGSDEYFVRLTPEFSTVQGDRVWLGHAFQDLLGRNIDSNSVTFFSNELGHGFSHRTATHQIVNSGEFRTREINQVYQQFLGRPADPVGLNGGLQTLASGGTLNQIKAVLLGSAEYYFGHGGGTNFGFLNGVFKDTQGRPVDDAGVAFWGTKLAQGVSRTNVALGILQDVNAEEAVVQAFYLAFLKRNADPVGQQFYAGQLLAGVSEDFVEADLVGTAEYIGKNSTT